MSDRVLNTSVYFPNYVTEKDFMKNITFPASKMKFFIKDFFSKCDRISTVKIFRKNNVSFRKKIYIYFLSLRGKKC